MAWLPSLAFVGHYQFFMAIVGFYLLGSLGLVALLALISLLVGFDWLLFSF